MPPSFMKDIICLAGFDSENCCGHKHEQFIHGIKIMNGRSVFIIEYPFTVTIHKKKFNINKNGIDVANYKFSEFNQTETEIRDLFSRCVFGNYENELKRIRFEFVVDDGSQNTFLCPIDGTYLGADYYDVYVNTTQVNQGTSELEYIVVDGNVFFTVPIEDITGPPDDLLPNIVTVTMWYKS